MYSCLSTFLKKMHILEFNIKIDTLCNLFCTNSLPNWINLSQDEKTKRVMGSEMLWYIRASTRLLGGGLSQISWTSWSVKGRIRSLRFSHHSSDNARSLTHWATKTKKVFLFFLMCFRNRSSPVKSYLGQSNISDLT